MSSLASTSRWTLDYAVPESAKPKVRDPPGYTQALSVKASEKKATSLIKPADLSALRQQKAWELALAPAKNVPMQAFMMYMSGGGIQIFSIMSVWFLLKQAVGGMFSVDKAFAPFEAASKAKQPASNDPPQSFMQQKIVYVLCQFALLCVGLWKTNSMGLLPTSREDWAPFYGAFSSSSAAADVAAAAAAATFAPFVPAPDPIGVGFEASSGVGVPA
ncbi:chaperone EMC4 [Rhodotorula paludigena]|uniref:chaperone EMC4 n=1 Tax=Rhodotorula paludigena TaxID=86838 RepID=UPI003171F888